MKIAYVQDISRPHGGAECSNRTVVSCGERLGHDIVGVTPMNFYPHVLDQADALVMNNFHQFSRAQADTVLETIWKKRTPYVVYSHDYRDLRRPKLWDQMLDRSRLNVFISPRHQLLYQQAFGCSGIALPLAIDTDLFRPVPGIPREENLALIVGGWVPGGKVGKALVDFVREHNTYRYAAVGCDVLGATPIPRRPLEQMPELYSRASAIVHLPDAEWAGERIVFEAALCGVKRFHLSETVGHVSWGFEGMEDYRLRQILRDAPEKFWQFVEEACAK